MKCKLEVEPFARDFMAEQGGKALALKPLEEAAEAFGAWQRYAGDEWDDTDGDLEDMLLDDIADELADTVQACVNLADREGLDLRAALSRVHDRNAKRGRHEVRQDCDKVATTAATADAVSHPSHYTGGSIECKDALASRLEGTGLAPMAVYWLGCAFNYLWRFERKNGVEDLRKCRQCIDFLIEEVSE